jgi:uncharacterized membrane protein HdeD (DUF308 family)
MDSTEKYIQGLGTAVIVAGVVGVICGIVAIVWPKTPLLALAIVAGFYLLCVGALCIGRAVAGDRDAASRALNAVLGLLGVIVGVAVIRRPGDSVLVIVIAVGLWLVAAGIVEAVRALATPGARAAGLLLAAVDVVLGILIVSWPKASVRTVAVLCGIAFVLRGALMVYGGIQLRRVEAVEAGRASGADAPPPLAA